MISYLSGDAWSPPSLVTPVLQLASGAAPTDMPGTH